MSEAEAIDENGLLRDGYTMSVPSMMRDGITGRIRQEVGDSMGRLMSTSEAIEEELSALDADDRPGGPSPTSPALRAARRTVHDAYEAAKRADENAWRDPKPWPGAAGLPAATPAHLMADALQMLDEKERAWREAQIADENAWWKG